MHNGIPICELFSDPCPFAYGDPRMHTAISVCKITHMGVQDLISHMEIFPVCIWLVTEISLYAYGDHANPRMPYGDYMSCDHRMYTGIAVIPICIWGSRSIPLCIRGLHVM
jgi:hypothetical protein